MRASVLRTVLALVAVTAAAAPAGAQSSFTGDVCGLVSAKQIAAIPGLSSRCTNARPAKGPGSTLYVGTWAGKTPTGRLQVTVALYTDPGALALAKRNLEQGFPGGTPRKAVGIGAAAYEASGATATAIHFSVGKYVAYLTLTGSGTSRSKKSLEALARRIAARL